MFILLGEDSCNVPDCQVNTESHEILAYWLTIID